MDIAANLTRPNVQGMIKATNATIDHSTKPLTTDRRAKSSLKEQFEQT